MELLVLKSGEQYLRIIPEGYELVNMSKASVYPIAQAEQVNVLWQSYIEELAGLEIRKLVITETDYQGQ